MPWNKLSNNCFISISGFAVKLLRLLLWLFYFLTQHYQDRNLYHFNVERPGRSLFIFKTLNFSLSLGAIFSLLFFLFSQRFKSIFSIDLVTRCHRSSLVYFHAYRKCALASYTRIKLGRFWEFSLDNRYSWCQIHCCHRSRVH